MSRIDGEPAGPAAPTLRRHAGPWSLWGLGVSVAVTGEFAGWNSGLIEGGFGGMLVATILISVMYLAMSLSAAELSAALPYAGGAYGFVRVALGPWLGCAAGIAQIVAYTAAAAAIAVSFGGFVASLGRQAGVDLPDFVWWGALYVLFVIFNVLGVVALFRLAITLALLALAALVGFWVVAVPAFDLTYALDVVAAPGGSTWLPNGLAGIAWAIPFAVWFYVGVEAVTLAGEETADPARAIPRGFLWSIVTLIAVAVPTLVLNSGVPPGATAVGLSTEPLLLAFSTVLAGQCGATLIAALGIAGQAASFHAMIYAYGRSIYAMGRAGYLPARLATLHAERRTPYVALIAGGVIGFVAALAGRLLPEALGLEAMLIAMAGFAAVFVCILSMIAFLRLRRDYPDMPRPYHSPAGATGAMTALVIAVAALGFMLVDRHLVTGIYGAAGFILLGLLHFALRGRHRLRPAPEETAAAALTASPVAEADAGKRPAHV